MTRVVLDAGALIALERDDRELWTVLKIAATTSNDVVVPGAVVAQIWRGSIRQARLASALKLCAIASFDAVAREIGELCGRTKTTDVCDAHVALVAMQSDVLYTSDPHDLRRLLAACRGRSPTIVRC